MGRKRSRFHNLPPRMRARVRGKVTYYFYDQRPKKPAEVSLGKVYPEAVRRWAELESAGHSVPDIITFAHVADRYMREVIPTKANSSQVSNLSELAKLREFFGDPPAALSKIRPMHVAQYLDWRTEHGTKAKVRANREKALLSHMWNKARQWGYTDAENPCKGIQGSEERGRDVYVEDDVFAAVYAVADQPLRDALDLSYLCGQRPADTRKYDETDLRDGFLHLKQGKTKERRRISVQGELAEVIERIKARKRACAVYHTGLIVDEDGRPMAAGALRYRFDKARRLAGVPKAAFQVRDLRAKAATDKAESAGDVRQAQKQLGHASVTMTEQYIRNRRGDKVTPTK
ncbi:tyrosine-type recombinase/integrase [Lysobacter capsici]|uniref:tyrosine-type recombinase/integrase n=1 Tax=Lysobacter capsici TaxID=435897 RepID=UPI00287B99C0|nr:tyrosine-type recombinase/integrase [Lysobacter capsici]WND83294.1 tyrosine-type recombinase/integrase [Lysobacter capsici]WND88491.1 tyrosine-type recombinase/integrase [Lysobacter capsici]